MMGNCLNAEKIAWNQITKNPKCSPMNVEHVHSPKWRGGGEQGGLGGPGSRLLPNAL